jgi:paraquat-inducible protein B
MINTINTQTNVTPPPLMASHGTKQGGDSIGAQKMLLSMLGFSQVVMALETTMANFSVQISGYQTTIQKELTTQTEALRKAYNMDTIESDVKLHSATTSTDVGMNGAESAANQQYTTQLQLLQTKIQSASKAFDPVATMAQNMPNSLISSLNEFLQEAGTLNQGMQSLANNKVN